MPKFNSRFRHLLLLGVLTTLGCHDPAAQEIPSNRPIEERLNQYQPFSAKTGKPVSTKADAIRVIYYSLCLKGARGPMSANWVVALNTSLNKAIPPDFLAGTEAKGKIAEMLYNLGYIDRAGVFVVPEILPTDRDKVVSCSQVYFMSQSHPIYQLINLFPPCNTHLQTHPCSSAVPCALNNNPLPRPSTSPRWMPGPFPSFASHLSQGHPNADTRDH